MPISDFTVREVRCPGCGQSFMVLMQPEGTPDRWEGWGVCPCKRAYEIVLYVKENEEDKIEFINLGEVDVKLFYTYSII